MRPVQPPADLTGVVLAGGRGQRMGGLDKGLQPYQGVPLALRALQRLTPQVSTTLLSANRNLAHYARFGAPVLPDTLPGQPGPLAGILAALQRCETPCLLSVPCDAPDFPPDLAQRLAAALNAAQADIAMAATREPGADGRAIVRPQPVFCLLRRHLAGPLQAYLVAGGRKASTWAQQHTCVRVLFEPPGDAPHAFFNANTLHDLHPPSPGEELRGQGP